MPVRIASAVRQGHDGLTIVEIDPDSSSGRFADSVRFPLANFGKILRVLKKSGVTHVCLAGKIGRPDFATFKPDMRAMQYLPGTVMAARQGDDALLRHVIDIFEKEGFQILSPQTLCEALKLPPGPLGMHRLTEAHRADAERAMEVARLIGSQDIGQGAVVAAGLVLAVEAQEGTDAMLARVKTLPPALRGEPGRPLGVLAKRLKPGQDDRVDMPTIGPTTVAHAAEAGLAGIIADAGQAFVMDMDETRRVADQAGLFIVGLPGAEDRPDG